MKRRTLLTKTGLTHLVKTTLLIAACSCFLIIDLAAKTVITDEKHAQLLALCPISNTFDFPVGKPDAKNYYNAQKFGKNTHLGDDWNGTGGGNSDFGDPVYAISDGIVVFAKDVKGGWGKVIRIYHNYGTKQQPLYIESLYAHLNKMVVTPETVVKRGDKIGTIGNVNGLYLAHLHLEIRDKINQPIGKGYAKNTIGYVDPTQFIRSHRKVKK